MRSRLPQGGVFWAPSGGAVPSFLDVANARDMASLLRLPAARGLAADRHLAPSLGHLPLVLLAHDVDTARNTLIADHSVAVAVSRRGHHELGLQVALAAETANDLMVLAHRRKRRRRDGRLAHRRKQRRDGRLARRPQPRRDHDEVVADIAAPAAFHWLGGVAEFSVSAEADRALLVAFLAHASVLASAWCGGGPFGRAKSVAVMS